MTPNGFAAIATLLFILCILSFFTGHWVIGLVLLATFGSMAIICYLIWGRDDNLE